METCVWLSESVQKLLTGREDIFGLSITNWKHRQKKKNWWGMLQWLATRNTHCTNSDRNSTPVFYSVGSSTTERRQTEGRDRERKGCWGAGGTGGTGTEKQKCFAKCRYIASRLSLLKTSVRRTMWKDRVQVHRLTVTALSLSLFLSLSHTHTLLFSCVHKVRGWSIGMSGIEGVDIYLAKCTWCISVQPFDLRLFAENVGREAACVSACSDSCR